MISECYTIWHKRITPRSGIKDHVVGDFLTEAEAITALEGIVKESHLTEVTEEEAERADFPAQWYDILTRTGRCVYSTPMYHDK